jgi:hypothetical protein
VSQRKPFSLRALRITGVALLVAVAVPASAQTDNICSAGEAPDIIVGEITSVGYFGTAGGVSAFAIGTDSCNVGTCQANWFELSSNHPVIAQNLFRLKDGRLEHIGQSWVKHGFAAIDETTCSPDCLEAPDDEHLGVNCSDLYGSGLNGPSRDWVPSSRSGRGRDSSPGPRPISISRETWSTSACRCTTTTWILP